MPCCLHPASTLTTICVLNLLKSWIHQHLHCVSHTFAITTDQQWGDLLNDLRAYSSGSGNRPPLTGVNSFSTDWIPELLCKKEVSARLNPAAAAAAGGQAGTAAAGQQQQQQGMGLADILEEGAAGDGGQGGNRKGKRERSKTGQAPTAEQRQEWQVSSSAMGGRNVSCLWKPAAATKVCLNARANSETSWVVVAVLTCAVCIAPAGAVWC